MQEPSGEIPSPDNNDGGLPPPKDSLSTKKENPDKEPILGAINEKIIVFFDETKINRVRIQEGAEEIRRAMQAGMEAQETSAELSSQVQNQAQGDSRVEQLSSMVRSVEQKLQEQLEVLMQKFSGSTHSEVLSFLGQQDLEWNVGGGVEVYMAGLREAVNDPNENTRSQKLAILKEKVMYLSLKVIEKGDRESNEYASVRETVDSNKSSISFQAGFMQDECHRLKDRFGDQYWNIVGKMENAGGAIERFHHGVNSLDNLPLEYKAIANKAHYLGVSITELFDLLEKDGKEVNPAQA